MGAAASAASPTAAAADPPAKGDVQHAIAADEAAVPTDSPAEEEIRSAALVETPEGNAAETVVLESGEQEEEGECGFCVFMKDGGCGEEFVGWEKCVEIAEAEGGDAIIERCSDAMTAMRRCIEGNPDYYEPIISYWRRPSLMPDKPPALAAEGDNEKKQAEEAVVVKEKVDAAA